MSDDRPDYVSRSNREFFEKVMAAHTCIEKFEGDGDRKYRVSRTHGDTVIVYLSGKYTFGILDFYQLRDDQPGVNCIVAASPYLSYTRDAKDAATAAEVGLFTVKEFMGALNFARFWDYVPKS